MTSQSQHIDSMRQNNMLITEHVSAEFHHIVLVMKNLINMFGWLAFITLRMTLNRYKQCTLDNISVSSGIFSNVGSLIGIKTPKHSTYHRLNGSSSSELMATSQSRQWEWSKFNPS